MAPAGDELLLLEGVLSSLPQAATETVIKVATAAAARRVFPDVRNMVVISLRMGGCAEVRVLRGALHLGATR
jgi:hypothetical protein